MKPHSARTATDFRMPATNLFRRPQSILAFSLLLAAADCGDDPSASNGECDRPPLQTFVFYDLSASSALDARTDLLFRESLAALPDEALSCQGDALRGFLVHAQTRGKIDRIEVVHTVAPPDTLGVSKMRAATAKTRYEAAMTSLRSDASQKLLALVNTNVPAGFRRQTDVIGAMEVISDELERHPDSRGRVYFFGDMHESTPATRDFDQRPPTTRAEAEAWADADTAVLGRMSIDPGRLGDVEVHVFLGGLAAKPNAPEVRIYWERLFQNAGLRPGSIRYN